jgi:Flp pilus assembly protein TadD
MNPSNATAYFDLGVVYQKSGNTRGAAQMYSKVLELQPGDPEALTSLQTLKSME